MKASTNTGRPSSSVKAQGRWCELTRHFGGPVVVSARRLSQYLPQTVLVFAAVLISLPHLASTRIDDIDSAHHIMDGIFFRDFIIDLPRSLRHPIAYTFSYYEQYPALGFVFWPPLFPAIEALFFLFGQIDVRVARVCVLAFGLLLALIIHALLRRSFSRATAVLTVLLILSTPIIAAFYQQIMLEIPALAVTFLSIFFYKRIVTHASLRWADLLLFSFTAAAAVYTKQTVVFIFPAFFLDAYVNHRDIFRNRRCWLSVLLLILLLTPLALYTVTIGKANLHQSIGSDKSFVLNSAAPPDRWSATGWLYYPTHLPRLLNPILILLAIGGVGYSLLNPVFFRANALWLGWIASWYLMFSYFLNKQDRYALFWLPSLIILAVAFLVALSRRYSCRSWIIYVILIISGIPALAGLSQTQTDGFDGLDTIFKTVTRYPPAGNILYIGEHHQMIIPFVRQYDVTRRIYTLRGLDLLSPTSDILAVCKDYRVRLIVTEGFDVPFRHETESLLARGRLVLLGTFPVTTRAGRIPMTVFHYPGPIASVQKRIPIGSGK